MGDMDTVRWMLTFYHSEGGSRDEPDFPRVDLWHPNEKASMEAGARVLRELKERGDNRDWKAAGHPDPFAVGSGQHPGGQWILPPPAPKIFDPDKLPPMDLTDAEWESFDRAIRESRTAAKHPVDRVYGILGRGSLGDGVSVEDYIEEIRGR